MKWAIRFRGSQALSGMIKYEARARIVTPAIMIGASSHDISTYTPHNKKGNSQFKVCPVTGNEYGENRIATTHPFQKTPMNWNGLLHRPRLHCGLGKRFGVQRRRPRQIRPYAAALGTPAAETREVKATLEGRMVQVTRAATPQTTMTALRGWPP
jgi:hypothetical protein